MGVLIMAALLFGVHSRARGCWKLPLEQWAAAVPAHTINISGKVKGHGSYLRTLVGAVV